MHKPIIEIYINGDPSGSGFQGSESKDGGKTFFFRGDIGTRTRDWWRWYCRMNKYTLRTRK